MEVPTKTNGMRACVHACVRVCDILLCKICFGDIIETSIWSPVVVKTLKYGENIPVSS